MISAARDAALSAEQSQQCSLLKNADRVQLLNELRAKQAACEADNDADEKRTGRKMTEEGLLLVAHNAACDVVNRNPRWNLSDRERRLVAQTWAGLRRLPTTNEVAADADVRDDLERFLDECDEGDSYHEYRMSRLDPSEIREMERYEGASRDQWT